ncbi:MAG: histidine phosphatase family protein [Rubrivivax sp.]|nr:MAG: histidine phosphatase family protein [Rubrivivax sp.]
MAEPQSQKWPDQLWIARHGQSAGNVARDAAEAAGMPVIDIADRDMDVPLSPLGVEQARALGRWVGGLAPEVRPNVLLCSPYIRARQTMQHVIEAGQVSLEDVSTVVDERLREKEFGLLDRLTHSGIRERFPDLFEQRRHVGKFYFRPPGGESWCDVILRLRGLLDTVTREYRRERVMIIAHQVIVNCMRYLIERLDEQQVLEIDRKGDVPNCGVTLYAFDPAAGRHGKLTLQQANFVAPLEMSGTPVTAAPDVPAAAKP